MRLVGVGIFCVVGLTVTAGLWRTATALAGSILAGIHGVILP